MGISTYSIDTGCIQQAMVQYDLTTAVYFNFYNICKPIFSNFELGKIYMHPCLLEALSTCKLGEYLCRQDGDKGVSWTVEPVT